MTSVAQFPHRNLLQMIFDAADQYQPHLNKATYYSLPEWFSPAYAPFGFSGWPGGNATNPFTNETLPYTGFVPIVYYVDDGTSESQKPFSETYDTNLIYR